MSAADTPPDGHLRGAADRYLDGDLDPAEREALRERLLADPAALRSFVGELRLAMAIGTALHDRAAERAARASLVMSTLSDSRRERALRRLEASTIGAQAPMAYSWARMAWTAMACAAALAAAIVWWEHRGPSPARRPLPANLIESPVDVRIAAAEPPGSSPAPAESAPTSAPVAPAPAPAPEAAVPTAQEPTTPAVAAQPAPAAPLPSEAAPPPAVTGATPVPSAERPVAAFRLPGSETPMLRSGAESWLGGYATVHRHGTATTVRGGSQVLVAGDVIDAGTEDDSELHLGSDQLVICSPSTRVVVLPGKPGVPGRRLALVWGGIAAALEGGAPLTIVTSHGEVRCDGGRTAVHAYQGWVRVAEDGGHAQLVGDGGKKGIEDGQYAVLVHGRAVIAPLARAASAALAGMVTMRGEPMLPCVLRLAPPPGPARGAWLRTLAEAGFTAVAVPAATIDGGLLGDAQDAGLAVIGEMAAERGAAESLMRGRAHPALLAWWMVGSSSRDTGRIADAVRRLDPLHVLAASFTGDQQRGVPPACDILVLDRDAAPAAMRASWSSPQVSAALRAKAVLAVVPLATAAGDKDGLRPDRPRCLAYLALVHGAEGLIWSAGASAATAPGALDQPVSIAAGVSAEIAKLAPLLLHGGRQRFQSDDTGFVAARWDGLGRCAVVAVNPSDRTLALSATVPGQRMIAPHLLAEAGAGDVHVSDGRMIGTLPPYGVAILVGETPFAP